MSVIERTECLSGWYTHCRQVLTWFLERRGIDPYVATGLVETAIGGRFESWVGPDPQLVEEVAERLTESIPPAADAGTGMDRPDDLQRWLEAWLAQEIEMSSEATRHRLDQDG